MEQVWQSALKSVQIVHPVFLNILDPTINLFYTPASQIAERRDNIENCRAGKE